jgi:hypothetical protein
MNSDWRRTARSSRFFIGRHLNESLKEETIVE